VFGGAGIVVAGPRRGACSAESRGGGVGVERCDRRASTNFTEGDQGINLPDSSLPHSALTRKDLADLRIVARHADVVSLSFANSARDVEQLLRALKRFNALHLGVVVKVETRRGFEALPSMLCSLLRLDRCGVMIARGDLAVGCGFERMAELQEEMLWVCEAAHVPVIWATQVLEGLAKTGSVSRAEISDAAMGERAECVMLNKGPHMTEAVTALDNVLTRMEPRSVQCSENRRSRITSWKRCSRPSLDVTGSPICTTPARSHQRSRSRRRDDSHPQ